MTTARLLKGLAAAGLALTASAALAANVVIVRSAGPSAKAYPPGKALGPGTNIALKPGDMVMLLGPNSSRTLRGPGTFPAISSSRGSLAMAAGKRSRFGAMRSGEITSAPSLWDIDVTQSGTVCVAEPAKLKLWRPNADSAATLSIRHGPATQPVEFAAGHATIPWPTQLPITNGGAYQLELTGSSDRSTVEVVTVGTPPSDQVEAAKLLIDKDCRNQLDLLIDSTDKAAD